MYHLKYSNFITSSLCLIVTNLYHSHVFAKTEYSSSIPNIKFSENGKYILLEALSDDIIHIETGDNLNNSQYNFPIFTSPMVQEQSFRGPTEFKQSASTIETANIGVNIDRKTFCISYTNKKLNYKLAKICPINNLDNNSLKIISTQNQNAYGLGQYFYDPNSADGDWVGRKWEPGEFGNAFVGFSGGANSKVQFPILYALGEEKQNYAIFIDSTYKMGWDFTNSNAWNVKVSDKKIRYFLIAGDNLEQLRQKYMSLIGNPTLPPKKMLGLWVSEYGYKNWNEVNSKLSSLRNNKFPIDGFALDLYWFGGTKGMGSLSFDENNFPNPIENIKKFKENGIEFIPIQESYISESAKTPNSNIGDYQDLLSRCYLVRKNATGCDPSYFKDTWWGSGGMIDWSNAKASAYWFQKKQVPLVNSGLSNFWLDLNEPEMYDPNAYYSGYVENGELKNRHADNANLYALKWIESLDKGYFTNRQNPNFSDRPFYISRAGSPGMQRMGAGMWSGDIGANLGALKAHINNQMNVSLSGIDFYSADTGGFHRNTFDGSNIEKLYTLWFANASVFDFPVRPHTVVGETNQSETAPSLIGDISSNRENLRQRYTLAPYYYSLFFRAHLFGEAVTPPLVTLFQSDKNVRKISSEKMIGKFLLGSTMFQYNDPIRKNIYLPEGRWLNYHTLDEITDTGKKYIDFPAYLNGKYKIPLFILGGAIIPQAFIDDKTMDIQGLRTDGTKIYDLIIAVVPSEKMTNFTLYEDDGRSLKYKEKNYSETEMTQVRKNNTAILTISPTIGKFSGIQESRKHVIKMAIPNEIVSYVALNGVLLEKCTDLVNENCWDTPSKNLAIAKTSKLNVRSSYVYEFNLQAKQSKNAHYTFTCLNGITNFGESIYIVGNSNEIGNWNTTKAIKLEPNEYPTWSKYIADFSTENKEIEWKCIKKKEFTNEVIEWQAGRNNILKTINSGYGGNFSGSF
ncbi:TIM-barrel domain-containing protein [Fluviispira multicolorata]|uniref:DUF5110 domain-containing protein n=1 Tax=Fluviispira multicolorata TaxID=2654512 RepID=A0A833N4F7_9BACT|nr:TIM-barrel domain-containing protein [Fluviispira multicolorata]KAB8027735.1 DUF5110 domain-containing protein [Fluviispira multicolorata]